MIAGGSTPARLRILIVEDHAPTARAIAMYLRGSGHQVDVAADAATARALAPTTKFDLLLADLGLPDGNGWDLLRELRDEREFKALAMSGHNSDGDRARSEAAGFAEHLPKPLMPEELEAAFARVMNGGAKR